MASVFTIGIAKEASLERLNAKNIKILNPDGGQPYTGQQVFHKNLFSFSLLDAELYNHRPLRLTLPAHTYQKLLCLIAGSAQ